MCRGLLWEADSPFGAPRCLIRRRAHYTFRMAEPATRTPPGDDAPPFDPVAVDRAYLQERARRRARTERSRARRHASAALLARAGRPDRGQRASSRHDLARDRAPLRPVDEHDRHARRTSREALAALVAGQPRACGRRGAAADRSAEVPRPPSMAPAPRSRSSGCPNARLARRPARRASSSALAAEIEGLRASRPRRPRELVRGAGRHGTPIGSRRPARRRGRRRRARARPPRRASTARRRAPPRSRRDLAGLAARLCDDRPRSGGESARPRSTRRRRARGGSRRRARVARIAARWPRRRPARRARSSGGSRPASWSSAARTGRGAGSDAASAWRRGDRARAPLAAVDGPSEGRARDASSSASRRSARCSSGSRRGARSGRATPRAARELRGARGARARARPSGRATLGFELERSRALLEVVGEAIARLSLAHTLETALERVAELLGTDRVAVYLDEDGAARRRRGPRRRRAARGGRGAPARPRARRLRAAAGVVEVDDASRTTGSRPGSRAGRRAGHRLGARAAAPRRRRSRSGCSRSTRAQPRPLTPNESALLVALAAQLAVAVQNARLHERATALGVELEERARARSGRPPSRSSALYEISRSFAQSLSLDDDARRARGVDRDACSGSTRR